MKAEIQDKGAYFNNDKSRRYVLWRTWDYLKPVAMCIGLNPSKADSDKDDATIRLLCTMLEHLGFGGLKMVNLYSCVTPHPKEIIPDDLNTMQYIKEAYHGSHEVIFCWGAFKGVEAKVILMKETFPEAKCFGKTANGSPWHPRALTYIKGTTESKAKLIPF